MSQSIPQNVNTTYLSNRGAEQRTSLAAVRNNTNQVLSGTVANDVTFGTNVIAATGPSVTIVGNTFRVNDTGVYRVSCNLTLIPANTGVHRVQAMNGATVLADYTFNVVTTSQPQPMIINALVSIAANTLVSIQATQPTASTCNVSGTAPTQAFFAITRIF